MALLSLPYYRIRWRMDCHDRFVMCPVSLFTGGSGGMGEISGTDDWLATPHPGCLTVRQYGHIILGHTASTPAAPDLKLLIDVESGKSFTRKV